MLLKTILFLCFCGYFHGAMAEETDMEPSSTNVKEITVSIQHNSDDTNTNDSNKNPHSKRTRANLLLNSKVVYPPGAKSASAFNQGVLKFQQLLELPLNESNSGTKELQSNVLDEAFNNSIELDPEIKNITLTEDTDMEHGTNCGNSTTHSENSSPVRGKSSLKILKNQFLEDFGTSGQKILNLISNITDNSNDTSIENFKNETLEVEFVKHSNLTVNGTDAEKSSIEILDDDMEDSNSTDVNSNNSTRNTYLPAERKSSDSKNIEIKPQKLQEIPLQSSHMKSSRKEDIADDISQNIKRDILLGNLNPFFSNPSTNSIRNTNSIFFDDMLKKSGGLIGRMNPFVINSISLDGSRSTTPTAPLFSRLKSKSSGTVKTLKSIALSEDSSSSPFGSKLGGSSSSSSSFTSSLGAASSSTGASFPNLGGQSSTFGGHSAKTTVQSSRAGGHVRGRRPGFSRFRNKPSKAKAATVETVPSIHLGDGKKVPPSNFASSSSSGSKTSVKTIPSLLIREEDESSKFSSKYPNKAPSAVSSASFTFTPSGSKGRSHGRSKSTSSYSRPKPQSSTSSYGKPKPSPKKGSEPEEGFQILKSVDYSLPEEVGKSLTKTGPAKFKRKAGFEPNKIPDYSMQSSVTVDPYMVNFDMSRKNQDDSINPYLVNTQMKAYRRKPEKSRSFEFRPSLPDSKTRQMREFNPNLQRANFFQPSLQFKAMTESPQEEVEMYEVDYPSEDEKVEKIQSISNFESDMLFKPYFTTQSPKSFHLTRNKKNERPPRSFETPEINFSNIQSPRSFQMAEPTTFRYFGNVHMIDLS